MKHRTKIILLCAGLSILFIHYVLVFFYAIPFNTQNKITAVSKGYVYPFFYQNWNLFAPVPDNNYRLLVEYKHKGIIHRDLFTEMLTKHQRNRLSGYGPMLLAFSNSIHYFEKNTSLHAQLNGPVKNDPYFQIIEHSVRNYLANCGISPARVKIYLVIENAGTKAHRIYFN